MSDNPLGDPPPYTPPPKPTVRIVEHLTAEGDVLDYIVWKHYGRQDERLVEYVLDYNYGLGELQALLPAGLVILLPPEPPRRKMSRLPLVRIFN